VAQAGGRRRAYADRRLSAGTQRDPSIRPRATTRRRDAAGAPSATPAQREQQEQAAREIREFFTFRTGQPSYFTGPTGPDQWSWLEVFPQHVFKNAAGESEQMSVGVAQNAVDGKLGVLSSPRAHGRSFHAGRQPQKTDHTGRNFAEQWGRVFEADPQFVFVTGWNEWVAGRKAYSPDGAFTAWGRSRSWTCSTRSFRATWSR
jgi:hypothetical protein